jgi:hypothetical protein
MSSVAVDQKSKQVIHECRHHEDQQKTGSSEKVKKIAKKKKRGVAIPCESYQSLCIITNDYQRQKAK